MGVVNETTLGKVLGAQTRARFHSLSSYVVYSRDDDCTRRFDLV